MYLSREQPHQDSSWGGKWIQGRVARLRSCQGSWPDAALGVRGLLLVTGQASCPGPPWCPGDARWSCFQGYQIPEQRERPTVEYNSEVDGSLQFPSFPISIYVNLDSLLQPLIPRLLACETGAQMPSKGKSGNGHRLYFFGLQNHSGRGLQPWN